MYFQFFGKISLIISIAEGLSTVVCYHVILTQSIYVLYDIRLTFPERKPQYVPLKSSRALVLEISVAVSMQLHFSEEQNC